MGLHIKETGRTANHMAKGPIISLTGLPIKGMYVLKYLLKSVFSGCMAKHTATVNLNYRMAISIRASGSTGTP